MKLLETSASICLILAALAAGAPQTLKEPESIDHEGRSAPVNEDAGSIPIAADQYAQHQKRWEKTNMYGYVWDLRSEHLKDYKQVKNGGSALYFCLAEGNQGAWVHPGFLKKQVLNKIDYLLQPHLIGDMPGSQWFYNSKGLDWQAHRNAGAYDNVMTEGWNDVTFAWSTTGDEGVKITRSAARDVVEEGLRLCTQEKWGVDRTIGFAAILDAKTALYVWAGETKDKEAKAKAGKKWQDVWQVPAGVDSGEWETFIQEVGHKDGYIKEWGS